MGCLCSKGSTADDYVPDNHKQREPVNQTPAKVVPPTRREEIVVPNRNSNASSSGNGIANSNVNGNGNGSVQTMSKPVPQNHTGSLRGTKDEEEKKTRIVARPTNSFHHRRVTMDEILNGGQTTISPTNSIPRGVEGELDAAGWPSWLTSVAAEAIQGWVPRSADSFEKLKKIGQGTYSTVYKARDLKTGKFVAMKKVRFVNMDPESVRFMAREILILRKLDHPNIMKLECLVTSRMSGSLYLVFEYMKHDLAGLSASPHIKFTEPQVKCYIQQLLRGLEHCHSHGILHRDIKGSNLLIDNNGVLKIADFGLANFFKPRPQQPLTSRVVTLWYRAPELLLGATSYGVSVDLWSVGCILAELFYGKPIMPGRTEVEQMHKIFKLCGSPSEEYWRRSKLPHATSFKPNHPYKRRVPETFKDFPPSALALINVLLSVEPEQRGTAASALKSEFFTTRPLPCDPSSLPKYPPSKEFDVKLREEEIRRRKAESVKGRVAESGRKGSRECKELHSPEFDAQDQGQSNAKSVSMRFNPREDGAAGFPIDPPRGERGNGMAHSSSMVHPHHTRRRVGSSGSGMEMRRQASQMPQAAAGSSTYKTNGKIYTKEFTGYVPQKSRIHYSGPLMPPGGNIDDMLKEHERQIQEAVRKSRFDKTRTKKNFEVRSQI